MTIVNSITAIPLAFQDGMRFRQSKFYCLLMTPPILACLVSIIGCTSTKSGPADTKSYSASHRSLFENIPGNDSAYQASEAKTYANQNDKLVQKSSGLRSNASEKADGFSDASWRRGLTNQDSAHAGSMNAGSMNAGSMNAGSMNADNHDEPEQNSSALHNIASTRANVFSDTSSRQGFTNHGTKIKSEFPTNTQDLVLEQNFIEKESNRIPIGGKNVAVSFMQKLEQEPTDSQRPRKVSPQDTIMQSSDRLETTEFANANAVTSGQITIQSNGPMDLPNGNYLPVSLDEAIRMAVENSEVIRELGGSILTGPDAIQSIYNPAITHSDPIFGEEAAISQFDATFSSSLFFEKNDRDVNNQFLGTNGTVLQDLGSFRNSIDKKTAYGTLLSLRSISDYDFNNAIGNRFGNPSSSWSQILEGEARQPLLRGLGAGINRIAGPGASVGEFNGIRVAMLRTDVSATQFKIAVRDLVSNVENAYWDLYYAYRDLEAKKAARDNALKSWQVIKTLSNAKKEGGEADKEGQAREQYFRFESDVQDAMYGRKTDATRTRNGSTGGTFRPTPGVRIAERRLRRIMGIDVNGNELLMTNDEPLIVSYSFDWDNLVADAESNRGELKIRSKRIEELNLQLLAAKNSALPQFDVVGRYRFRGFGKDLAGSSPTFPIGAWNDLVDGDHQEWQAGFEFNMPFGFRQAYSAIQNINQKLTREKQILHEQRRQIVNDLSDAVQDLKRSFTVYELQYNRLQGALDQLKAVEKTNALKKAPINLVLEAQRRVLDAQTQLFRSKIEYVLALRNVHLEKGTLLENKQIVFSDSTDPNGMMMNPVSETISKSNSMTESFVMPLASERTSSNKKNSQPLSSATVSNSSLASQRRQIGGSQNSNRTKLPAQIPGFGMARPSPTTETDRTAQMIGGDTYR